MKEITVARNQKHSVFRVIDSIVTRERENSGGNLYSKRMQELKPNFQIISIGIDSKINNFDLNFFENQENPLTSP